VQRFAEARFSIRRERAARARSASARAGKRSGRDSANPTRRGYHSARSGCGAVRCPRPSSTLRVALQALTAQCLRSEFAARLGHRGRTPTARLRPPRVGQISACASVVKSALKTPAASAKVSVCHGVSCHGAPFRMNWRYSSGSITSVSKVALTRPPMRRWRAGGWISRAGPRQNQQGANQPKAAMLAVISTGRSRRKRHGSRTTAGRLSGPDCGQIG